MATIRFSVNQRTQAALAKKAADKAIDIIITKARKNFKSAKEDIKRTIDSAITEVSHFFIPSIEEAYELGIGEGGEVDTGRLEGAWKYLLLSSESKVTTIKFRKGEGKTGVGNIAFNIDYESFFSQEKCRIPTPDSEAIEEIPWMRWYIDGAEVNDFHFFPTRTRRKVSRTGGGIMIMGGFWTFRPHNEALQNLNFTIKHAVENFLKDFVLREIGQ